MTLENIKSALEPACQPIARRELAIMARDAVRGEMALQPIILTGYAGLGKSYLAETLLYGGILREAGWKLAPIQPGTSAAGLIKTLVDKALDGSVEPVLFWLDEMHSLPAATRNILKSVTETGGRVKDFTFPLGKESFTVRIDPRRHWFLGASNEAVKDTALVGASGRFMPLQLLPYGPKDKETIFAALLPHYGGREIGELPAELQEMAVKNCRPFARSIKRMISELRMEKIGGNPLKTADDLKRALSRAGYLPGGWRKEHLSVLRYVLASAVGRQVQEIAAAPLRGMDAKGASEVLAEMAQGELIITLANGRKSFTETGKKFVADLDKAIAKAKEAAAKS